MKAQHACWGQMSNHRPLNEMVAEITSYDNAKRISSSLAVLRDSLSITVKLIIECFRDAQTQGITCILPRDRDLRLDSP